jgi:hypothetical protein
MRSNAQRTRRLGVPQQLLQLQLLQLQLLQLQLQPQQRGGP